MTALKKGWEEYWFTPASPFPIAGLRIFSCLFLFYYFGYFHTFNPDLAGVSEAFWDPQTFFRWIDRDFLLPEVFVWTRWLILTFAFTALVGIKTRLSLISLFFLLLFHFGFEVNFYKPRQYEVTTVYVFFFLALSRCFDVWSVDARLRSKHQAQTGEKPPIPAASWRYQWPIRAIAAAICYLYISAGFVKLAKSGTAWFLTDNLAFVFVFLDHPPGVWLGQNYPQLCRWLAFLTLIFEFAFLGYFIKPRWGQLLFIPSVMFHFSVVTLFGLVFFDFAIFHVFLLDWSWLRQKLLAKNQALAPSSEEKPPRQFRTRFKLGAIVILAMLLWETLGDPFKPFHWPFVSFSMFSNMYLPEDRNFQNVEALLVLEDGSEAKIRRPFSYPFRPKHFREILYKQLRAKQLDRVQLAIEDTLARYLKRSGDGLYNGQKITGIHFYKNQWFDVDVSRFQRQKPDKRELIKAIYVKDLGL